MSKLQAATPEDLQRLKLEASAYFGPKMLKESLLRLCQVCGSDSLERFEKNMVDQIEAMQDDDRANFETLKEFAIEQLYACVREVKSSPDMKQPLEEAETRRTSGRSQKPETLEDQLQAGLEDSFPASDPPAVVSTAIPGGSKKLVGTDEVLKKQREEAAKNNSRS
ncbi:MULTISPECIES: hypothetical protein [unclassified Mesorhizobium]|uniref:hypothetical protein n=1 Tax=unclassified Mesorhizobium TaxID=325217 RepID=UPI000FD1925E|nr:MULTISPECIES: hypothetical protein [unclassified Mesorhizobium]RVB80358.1 hypothetical protein EN885_00170 [Mesorhizobium sp. M6A.T.Cr.TU.014.01.1.1]RWQ10459.1 MAG: hypothetical protein EOR91_04400 [Mesorhizobium sp.]RWQ11057.1 MAG: hypothetical protein EOR90_04760 [Mesorhizobium sp.]